MRSCGNCAPPADGVPQRLYNRGWSALHGTAYDPDAEPPPTDAGSAARKPGKRRGPGSVGLLPATAATTAAAARSAGLSARLLSRKARAAGAAPAGIQPEALLRRSGHSAARRAGARRAASQDRSAGGSRRETGEAEGRSQHPCGGVRRFAGRLRPPGTRCAFRREPGRGGGREGARRCQPRARRSGRLAEFRQGDPRWRTEDLCRRRDARDERPAVDPGGRRDDRAPVRPLEGPLPEAGRRDRDRFQGARDPRWSGSACRR